MNTVMFVIRKIISDGEKYFMQNTCNKWIMYRNVPSKYDNANFGSSAIYLHGVDMIDMQFQN